MDQEVRMLGRVMTNGIIDLTADNGNIIIMNNITIIDLTNEDDDKDAQIKYLQEITNGDEGDPVSMCAFHEWNSLDLKHYVPMQVGERTYVFQPETIHGLLYESEGGPCNPMTRDAFSEHEIQDLEQRLTEYVKEKSLTETSLTTNTV